MSIDRNELFGKYIAFDKPVPYKDFMIYPVRMKDSWEASVPIGLLELDKNSMGSIELIQMPHMIFWINMLMRQGGGLDTIEWFLRTILNIDNDDIIQLTYDLKEIRIGTPIGNTRDGYAILGEDYRTITCDDFDEIKRIVCFQNIIDYTDEYISPVVRQATEDYFRLINNGKSASLDHKVRCMALAIGVSKEAIGEMTMRDFHLMYESLSNKNEYEALRIAEANGAKFKQPLESWLYREHKNKYEQAFCDADSFESYIASAN